MDQPPSRYDAKCRNRERRLGLLGIQPRRAVSTPPLSSTPRPATHTSLNPARKDTPDGCSLQESFRPERLDVSRRRVLLEEAQRGLPSQILEQFVELRKRESESAAQLIANLIHAPTAVVVVLHHPVSDLLVGASLDRDEVLALPDQVPTHFASLLSVLWAPSE